MSTFLLLECSPYGEESLGTQLNWEAVDQFQFGRPEIHVIRRSLANSRLRAVSGAYGQARLESSMHTSDDILDSDELIDELERSTCVLISTPVHNFAVPSVLKLWIDHVVREGRTFKRAHRGKIGLLKDRPTLVLVRSDSPCVGEGVSQPDFVTPYLRHVFSVIGIHSTEFIYLAGENPKANDIAVTRAKLSASLEFSSRVFRLAANNYRVGSGVV
ncbi:NAD(P)H-dependent oxidoreductase [Burkholderia sp. Ac-20365]|uniref:FMN-dependent NADH-azoreductase n=1 Tax=Burkholderia sp. Ac-20365 TaxID=2703897 RepID=UPI00197C6821|nr:NAD(P)H-dependent oxidoreductase [Burkholderia sp. Ac-20365]MBN3759206.1 FMN-dependent NADH-azoreductase [Burkholderia sp. Ac-20365]